MIRDNAINMEKEEKGHIPVLLNEVVEYLNPQPGQVFIDCTLGGGGHTLAIAERLQSDGQVLSIDLDSQAIERFKKQNKYKIQPEADSPLAKKIKLVQGNFKDLKKIAYDNGLNKVSGIPVVKLSDSPSKAIGDKDALRVAKWTFFNNPLDA